MNFKLIIAMVLLGVFIALILAVFLVSRKNKDYRITTKSIVRVGIFGALAFILYMFVDIALPIFPSFLKIHVDEIPIFIASFAYGPITGICITFIKTLLKLPFTHTMGVGELSDLIYTIAFITPAAFLYQKHRNLKTVFIGLVLGLVLQVGIALIGNIYVMIPFYIKLMNYPEEAILGMCQAANPKISDIGWDYGIYAVLPFNLLKDAIVIAVTLVTYKPLRKLIEKMHG